LCRILKVQRNERASAEVRRFAPSAKSRNDRILTEPDFSKYYDLEGYIFGEVAQRFRRDRCLSVFDLFSIVIWKANRSKSKIARRLSAKGESDLPSAVKSLTAEIAAAIDSKERLAVLIENWGFRLPMASAILSVLYPDDFTVYDARVCEILGDFADAQYKKFADLWPRYSAYIERVRSEVPEMATLRDKDRYLWGKSFELQLNSDIKVGFGTCIDDSVVDA